MSKEFRLGRNVTGLASSRGKGKGTVVLSVRVTNEELAEIDRVAKESNQSISRIVRDAIVTGLHRGTRPQYRSVNMSTGSCTLTLENDEDNRSGAPIRYESPDLTLTR